MVMGSAWPSRGEEVDFAVVTMVTLGADIHAECPPRPGLGMLEGKQPSDETVHRKPSLGERGGARCLGPRWA